MSTTLTSGQKPASPPKRRARIDVFGVDPKDMTLMQRLNAITGYDLRYRIEAVVSGITDKKLRHIYRGDGAATGPDIMLLPAIPQTKLFDQEHANILLGYTMHEICHQLLTDFEILDKIFATTGKPTAREKQLKSFWNAIEDYRIEKLGRIRYPGFHKFIGHTRHFSAKRFVERVDAGEVPSNVLANPYAIGAVAVTWVGAKLNGYPTTMSEEALRRLDPDLRKWVESWTPDLSQVTTNHEAYDLANKMLDDLDQQRQNQQQDSGDQSQQSQQQNQKQDPDQQQQSGQGSSGDNDDSDDNSDQKSDDKKGKPSKSKKGKDDDNSDAPDKADGQNDEDQNESENASDDSQSDDQNKSADQDDNQAGDGQEQQDDEESSTGEGDDTDDTDDQPGSDTSQDNEDQSDGADGEQDDTDSGETGEQSDSDQTDEGDDSTNSANDDGDDNADQNGDEDTGQGQDGQDDQDNAPGKQGQDDDDAASQSNSRSNSTDNSDPSGGDQDSGEKDDGSAPTSGNDEDQCDNGDGAGQGRPKVKIEDGDEDTEAQGADLELDEVSDQLQKQMRPEDRIKLDINEEVGKSDETEVTRGQKRYTQIRGEIGPAAARAAGIMRRLLMARNITRTRRQLDEGALDLSRLVPIVNGCQDVYKRTATRTDVNTAVSILVDNSGSMNGHPIFLCQQASVVLDMAIQGTKADIEITGFTGSIYHPIIYRYRNFGQKGQAASCSLGNMDQVGLGGTPVSQAMLDAWRRLAQNKAERKIMIILTDGDVDDSARAREVHNLIQAMGGMVVGIGIGNVTSLRQWCDNLTLVTEVNELPIALSQIVHQAMTPMRKAA